jgi:hypothetical protein
VAIVATPSLHVPNSWTGTGTVPGLGTAFTFNASGQKMGWVFQAPKTGSIRKVHFLTGAVTTPTDTDVRIETVNTGAGTGDPSGTLLGANTNVTLPSASITTNTWTISPALTSDAAVTKGDIISAVLVPTGTPNFIINQYTTGVSASTRFPYSTTFNGATWSKQTAFSVFAVEYSDGTFDEISQVFPVTSINAHTFSTAGTPDEHALRFSLPFTARVAGIWIVADPDGDVDLVLYDGTSALATKTFDTDIRQGTGAGVHYLRFAAAVTVTANTVYRIGLKPTTPTNIVLYSMDVNSNAIMNQLGGGQNFYHSTRVDGGSWTDVTTRRLFAGLILDGVDVTSGGGGGSAAASVGYVS